MSDDKGAGGDDQSAGGTDDKSSNDKGGSKDAVAYETHVKLLDEKKKLQQRLSEFEKKAKDEKDAELKQKEQYKDLYEAAEKEKQDLAAKLNEKNREAVDLKKMGAFLRNVEAQIPKQYWGLVDLDKIVVDDSGSIDENSVKRAVKDFEKTYPEVLKKPGNKMPNDAAAGGAGSLSAEEWAKLPYDEKRKRIKDVNLA